MTTVEGRREKVVDVTMELRAEGKLAEPDRINLKLPPQSIQ